MAGLADVMEGSAQANRTRAIRRKDKTYHGGECKVHKGNFTRYTSNGSCVLCVKYEADGRGGKVRGYIAKKKDSLAFRHPVSPWPITASNMDQCPDLSPRRTVPTT